ncbi:MAG: hypothetical protein K6U89_02890 [Chloroflexi bacterium]|nr:hypothetical protein [Chloroflexota bacterium]GIW12347.1 MAG: hypothetical protein KatS3mg061_3404 [Dehalococcoidia bacterium]
MEVYREKIPGRVESVVIRQVGPWNEVCILGWDDQPRTVWKFPEMEQARQKAVEVKRWLEEGKLW